MEREAKPDWADVPRNLHYRIAELVGAMPVEAQTIWGSYSPSASFRIRLADGRYVFAKGSYPGQDSFGRRANEREAQIYEALPALAHVAPHYYGSIDEAGWFLNILECLNPAGPTLPWTDDRVHAVLLRLAHVHHLYPSYDRLPPLIYKVLEDPFCGSVLKGEEGWCLLTEATWPQVLKLAGDNAVWLAQHIDRLRSDGAHAQSVSDREALLHMDVRSDNVIFDQERGAVLLDWPFACWGPLSFELVYFLLTLEAQGAGPCERYLPIIRDVFNYEISPLSWRCMLANAMGFFAVHGVKPEMSALPRLRQWQRDSFLAALATYRRTVID